MVEADWAIQEKRLGRAVDSPDALRDVLRRAGRLLDSLAALPGGPDVSGPRADLAGLRGKAEAADSLPPAARLDLYRSARQLIRRIALAHPLLAGRPILFLQRRRHICQMLHEYHGYWYDKVAPGGGVFVLRRPGESLEVRDVTAGRPGEGSYTTLALSYDGRTAYFAFVEAKARPAEYRSADWMPFAVLGRMDRPLPQTGWRCFHLYAVDTSGGGVRRLTDGPNDDFDPCPLPDGGLAFLSTRRGGYTRCNNDWEPLPVYTLHRMAPPPGGAGVAAAKSIRPLSFHETNEWHPVVLNDGRIAYSRWDYVDRSAANFHGIWATNPDGTAPVAIFGSYTRRVNACYHPRPIPGSRKIAFLAGAHHADVGGSLLVLDPDRVALDGRSGEDDLAAIERITPWIEFPEAPGWPASFVHSPWPLSEDHFLVAYSHEPLPGMSGRTQKDVPTGLYYLDRFGNLELLYRAEGISCMYPIPLAARPAPPVMPTIKTFAPWEGSLSPLRGSEHKTLPTQGLRPGLMTLAPPGPRQPLRGWLRGNTRVVEASASASARLSSPKSGNPQSAIRDPQSAAGEARADGVFMLADVMRGLYLLPEGRVVKTLRIFQVLPKTWTHTNNRPRIGHANAESTRMLLGEVPVEADGSAHFHAPAGKPLYFQAVDADGRAVQTMRSVAYLQAGEARGCVGCHEPRAAVPAARAMAAMRRPASAIRPGPDGTRPFCYARLIQPILDRHCLRCHDGKQAGAAEAGNGGDKAGKGAGKENAKPILTGEPAGDFTRSYHALRPYLRWYEWGGASITQDVTFPGACGADASRLPKILAAHAQAQRVKLTDEELRRIFLWLDGNVPFYGVYDDAPRAAQQQGRAVPEPEIQ